MASRFLYTYIQDCCMLYGIRVFRFGIEHCLLCPPRDSLPDHMTSSWTVKHQQLQEALHAARMAVRTYSEAHRRLRVQNQGPCVQTSVSCCLLTHYPKCPCAACHCLAQYGYNTFLFGSNNQIRRLSLKRSFTEEAAHKFARHRSGA